MSESEEENSLSSYTGLIILALTLPIAIIFKHFGKADVGTNIAFCLGASMFAARMRWRLRRHAWFWIALAAVLIVQWAIAVRIPWPHWWVSRVVLLPIGLTSLCLSLGGIALAEKLFAKPAPHDNDLEEKQN